MPENAIFTTESIQKIEIELGLTLPETYRNTLLTYPFEEDSYAYDWELFGNAQAIVKENKSYREIGFFGQDWPETYLVIGGDGAGNLYYLDISRQNSPVFFADHEDTSYSEAAPDLSSWVKHIQKENAEDEVEEAERQLRELQTAGAKRNKKWWQFWI